VVKSWPLAALLTLLGLVSAPSIQTMSAVDQRMDALGLVLIGLAGVALGLRHRWPVPTLVVVGPSVATYLVLGYPYGPIMLCLAVAVYSVARRVPLVPAAIWSAGALLVLLAHLFGISGMRRRVTHLGGRLDAGEEDGMFEVRATIPTEPA
jgi:hypothetical protein